MKYCLTYPDRFGSIEDANSFCRDFFNWYNNDHYHSGINMLTPVSVHNGDADKILAKRVSTKIKVFKRHRERFVNGRPKTQKLTKEVWINPPRVGDNQISSHNQEVKSLKAKNRRNDQLKFER